MKSTVNDLDTKVHMSSISTLCIHHEVTMLLTCSLTSFVIDALDTNNFLFFYLFFGLNISFSFSFNSFWMIKRHVTAVI